MTAMSACGTHLGVLCSSRLLTHSHCFGAVSEGLGANGQGQKMCSRPERGWRPLFPRRRGARGPAQALSRRLVLIRQCRELQPSTSIFFFLCDGTARGLSRRMGIFRKRTASPKGLLCVLSMTVEASRIVASITPHHFPGFSTSLFPGLVSIINRDPDLGQGVEQPLRMAALPSPRELVAVCLLLHRLLPQWCTAWRLPISSRTASPVVDWIGRDSCPPCVPGLQPINMGMGKKKLGVGDSHGLTAFFSLFVLQRIS